MFKQDVPLANVHRLIYEYWIQSDVRKERGGHQQAATLHLHGVVELVTAEDSAGVERFD